MIFRVKQVTSVWNKILEESLVVEAQAFHHEDNPEAAPATPQCDPDQVRIPGDGRGHAPHTELWLLM